MSDGSGGEAARQADVAHVAAPASSAASGEPLGVPPGVPKGKRFREIERLRGLAILLTVLVHYWFVRPLIPDALTFTWSGVDLFFVISGFVVTLSLARELHGGITGDFAERLAKCGAALKAFYVRRMYRLLPVACLVFALQATLIVCAGGSTRAFGTLANLTREIVLILSGLYNYAMGGPGEFHLLAFWSLCVEEHFYLTLPLLLILVPRRGPRLLACLAVVALVALVVRPLASPGVPWELARLPSHLRFDSLMAGVFLALAFAGSAGPRRPLALPRSFVKYAFLPACMFILAALPTYMAEPAMNRWGLVPLWLVSAVLVAHAARDENLVLGFPLLAPAAEWIGARSYAMYVMHGPLLAGAIVLASRHAWEITPRSHALIFAAINLAVLAVLSDLAYRWIERPFIAAGRARVEAWRRGEPVAPGVRWAPVIGASAAVLGSIALGWVLLTWPARGPFVWRAQYFMNGDLAGSPLLRGDRDIDFFWGTDGPAPSVPTRFSARWDGCLLADHATEAVFLMAADDGMRLKVDDQWVVDDWHPHPVEYRTARVALGRGAHALRVEYFNEGGDGSVILRAGFEGAAPGRIPSSRFFPADAPGAPKQCFR